MRRLATLALLVLSVCLTVACARTGPSPDERTGDEARSAAFGESAHQCEPGKEEWRASGPPMRGGVFFKGGSAFEHVDPTRTGRVATLTQVYNALVEYRACFFGDYAPARPRLAKSWEVSPDSTTWTFKLREGVTWQNSPPVNGRAFTSADVAWTVEYQKRGGLLRSFWQDVSVVAQDPQTVLFRLDGADADFLGRLSDHRNVFIPREVFERDGDFKTTAVGTGAFMVKEYKLGQGVTMVRRPDYWEKGADGQSLPYLDEVHSVVFGDPSAEIAAVRVGQLDHLSAQALTAANRGPLFQANPKLQYFEEIFPAYYAAYFNLRRATPFQDPRVRRAVSLAIDREALIILAGGGVWASFLPPYLADWAWPQEKIKSHNQRDPEAARKLLAEAGYTPGSIRSVLLTSSQYQQGAELAQQHLAEVGINLTIALDPGASYSAVLQKADFDIGWGAYSGPNFPNFWVGDFIRSDSNQNFLGLKDPEVDRLVAAHSRELDVEKRKQLLDQLERRLYDTMPFVPTISHYYRAALSCRVKNFPRTRSNVNLPMVVEAWLDPTGC